MRGVTYKYLKSLRILVLLPLLFSTFLLACRTENDPKQNEPTTDPFELQQLPNDTGGVEIPPVGYFAPPLDPNRTYAQAYNSALGRAVVTGLQGGAQPGVTTVSILNSASGRTFTGSVSSDGSFVIEIEAAVGDALKLWTDGPGFVAGGVGKNDISETVESWSTQFPTYTKTHALLLTAGGLYAGSDDGLYRFAASDLSKPAAEARPVKFTVAHALPGNSVRSLAVDSNGNLWVGTNGGLARYQPNPAVLQQFVPFTSSNGLPVGAVDVLKADLAGGLWIGIDDELLFLDTKSSSATFTPIASFGYPISDIAIDAAGRIWIGTAGGGLSLVSISGGVVDTVTFDGTTDSEDFVGDVPLPPNVHDIVIDRWGRMLLGTGLGLLQALYLDGEPPIFFPFSASTGAAMVRTMTVGPDDSLWVKMAQGGNLIRFEFNSSGYSVKETTYSTTGLAGQPTSMAAGNKVWIGSTLEIGALDLSATPAKIESYSVTTDLSHNDVSSVLQDESRGTWVGTFYGLSLMSFGGNQVHYQSFLRDSHQSNTIAGDHILALAKDRPGRLWIGTDIGLSVASLSATGISSFTNYVRNLSDPLSLPDNRIQALAVESEGIVWIGTLRGLSRAVVDSAGNLSFTNFSTADGLPGNDIQSLAIDTSGRVWIGTPQGLASAEKNSGGQITISNYTSSLPLSSRWVESLATDSSGAVWIGTQQAGLVRLTDPFGSMKVDLFSTTEGLASDSILSVAIDAKGSIWVGSDAGLQVFSPGTTNITLLRSFTASSGLPSESVQSLGIGSFNGIWIGTDNGVALLTNW